MKMHILPAIIAIFSGVTLLADATAINLLQDTAFDAMPEASAWNYVGQPGWQVEKAQDGSRSLVKRREEATGEYALVHQSFPHQPKAFYEFGGLMKLEAVTGRGAGMAVEWKDAATGEHVYGSYIDRFTGSHGWQAIHGLFQAPVNPLREDGTVRELRLQLTLYLAPDSTGMVAYRDLYVRPAQPRWCVDVSHPARHTLTTADRELTIRQKMLFVDDEWRTTGSIVKWHLSNYIGKVVASGQAAADQSAFKVMFPPLPPGPSRMILSFAKEDGNQIIAQEVIDFKVITPEERATWRTDFDAHGHLLLNGKKFLPVGMFKHRLVSHEEVDKIRELGFNVACIYLGYEITEDILNYCAEKGLYLLIPQFIALPTGVQYTWDVPEWRGHRGPAAIRRGIVEAYAKHPAVIGWYLGDEIEPSFIHHLKQLNHDCHELSPELMTWHAGFYHDILPLFYDCADVFGYDFYPIARIGQEKTTEIPVRLEYFRQDFGQSGWCYIPQYFNHATFNKDGETPEGFAKYRYPTFEETLYTIIASYLHGSRAFVGWGYDCIHYRQKMDPGRPEKQLPMLARVNSICKSLEAWLLSDSEPVQPELADKVGDVAVSTFVDDNGKPCVIIAASTAAQVTFSAPKGLQPTFGLSTEFADGLYRFSCNGTAVEILR
ncbi:MAG: hypothetical protein IKZ46_08185 [Victivallales bacterium]|nr:hypothetical protein [Victivallales bacterium]